MSHNNTLNWLTSYSLSSIQTIGWNDPGLYLGDVTEYYDLINFWNLRATGIELIFFDNNYKEHLDSFKEAYIKHLQSRPLSIYTQSEAVGIWMKAENQEKFKQFGFNSPTVRCHISSDIWNGLNIKAPFWYFKNKSTLGILSESPSHTLSFQLPEKPSADELTDTSQRLVASLNIISDIQDNKRTFHTPCIPELNLYYGKELFSGFKTLRMEPDGIGIIIENDKEHMNIHPTSYTKIIKGLF